MTNKVNVEKSVNLSLEILKLFGNNELEICLGAISVILLQVGRSKILKHEAIGMMKSVLKEIEKDKTK